MYNPVSADYQAVFGIRPANITPISWHTGLMFQFLFHFLLLAKF